MREYIKLDEETLRQKADANDSAALAEMGFRALDNDDKENAVKYLYLSMVLGHTQSCFALGGLYFNLGNAEKALEAFYQGQRAGDEDCIYAYAALTLTHGDSEALDVILNYANDGHAESIKILEDFYREQGNKRESEFWRKKGAALAEKK